MTGSKGDLSPGAGERRLCPLFCGPELFEYARWRGVVIGNVTLSRAAETTGTYTGRKRRRADSAVHRRPGVVPGVRESQPVNSDRRCGPYSRQREAPHGAAKDSWFAHLAVEIPGRAPGNEWREPVDDEVYGKLPQL